MSAVEKDNLKNLNASLEESLESPGEKKKRIISLFIVHLSILVMSLGSSMLTTGVYPYLISVG